MASLHWVSVSALLNAVSKTSAKLPWVYAPDGTKYPIFRVTAGIVHYLKQYLRDVIHNGRPDFIPPVPLSARESNAPSPLRLGHSPARGYHSSPSRPTEPRDNKHRAPGSARHSRRRQSKRSERTRSQPSTVTRNQENKASTMSPYARPFYPQSAGNTARTTPQRTNVTAPHRDITRQ